MTIENKTVLITGANRGIGKALVEEALKRGAKRVYAGTRQELTHSDDRVVPVVLDVTNADHIQAAVQQVDTLDILINNAGIATYDDGTDPAALDQMLAVNYHGVNNVIQAFLPKLTETKGAVVTNVSVNAFAALPLIPAYSVSKAAVFNLMQSLRGILAARGVSVHSVLTGIVDTDMTAGFDVPKSSPQDVAQGIFDGIDNGEEDIFPDAMTQPMADAWRNGPAKALERQYAEIYTQVVQQMAAAQQQ
jgi:NAD(P)-dependent dehydrogenase (short-subunit alcohol dehydrogenase family)